MSRWKLLRRRAGLTQEQLAHRLELPQSTISNIERGVHGWHGLTTFARYVDELGLTDAEILSLLRETKEPRKAA